MPYKARPSSRPKHRRSIRLPEHNYTQTGAYFVTICARGRERLFGQIVGDEMRLNETGRIVQACWHEIPIHFPHVELDAFVVMPNHVHGIILIVAEPVGATHASPLPPTHASPLQGHPRGPKRGSIGAIVGSFKSAATKHINELRDAPGPPVWQRNYYEHVIRNETELARIRDYIQTNPIRWALDRENPARQGTDDFDRWLDTYPS